MRIAVVHDWVTFYAGSERVLTQILSLFPNCDFFTLIDFLTPFDRQGIKNPVTISFLQHLPFARKRYRNYLPLMPLAIEQFDLSAYDLIISSSHAVAKGVRTRQNQLHICYCHTPMRYAWDLKEQYLRESGLDSGLKGLLANMTLQYLQRWDKRTADRVTYFIANSRYIGDRIRRAYGRDSAVIYPPGDVETFVPAGKKEGFYLTASRMVPYKKMDIIVEAFSALPDKKLIVIGDGPDFKKVKSKAGRNIELLGFQPANILKEYMQRARAFVFAAEEDFGIMPVEAQACGTPVIAYGKGGCLETINGLNGGIGHLPPTGLFFYEQSVNAVNNAIALFEMNYNKFNGQEIRQNAIRFSVERFKREMKAFINGKLGNKINQPS
jgi:glycosyltransferase involved in cell wall biosynthesis